ncbi:hypothetical protein Fcan01_22365 [Folsomia candida]|uniref:Uncharacterized protein n=1 Tax=Folsomia candida TaxID=158441 RepID=A0A226DD85_FOLCA|nr:hypothetical protein Fcan01_22365 [Folsomia candida]
MTFRGRKGPLFFALCVLLLSSSASGQSWSSNYQSYTSPKDVSNKIVENYVDPGGKNGVDGGGQIQGDVSITEAPQRKEGTAGGGQSMYYYEMFPAAAGGQAAQPAVAQHHAGQGRQLCSYTESGAMRCQPKSVAASNAIPQYSGGHYYRRPSDNRQSYGVEETMGGWGQEEEEGGGEGGGASGLTGLLGALGLLGLKGAKGLITLAPFALALPFLPILLPILLAPILLPLLALLLFIPIPVVVTPAGRSVSNGIAEFSARAIKMGGLLPEMVTEVVQSEECVERISCEVARVGRKWGVGMDGWVEGLTSSLPKESKYKKKILTGMKPDKKSGAGATSRKTAPEDDTDCSVFSCNAKSILAKHMTKI